MLDAEARLKRRLVGPAEKQNALMDDPYGWAPADRMMREAPLWMVLETERDEIRLPPRREKKLSAEERVGKLIAGPVIDEQGRAYGTGRRKTSVAQVWIAPGDGTWTLNGQDMAGYFPRLLHRRVAMEALVATQACGAFTVVSRVHGGGKSGQAGALKQGVAKALAAYDPYLKPLLKQCEWSDHAWRAASPRPASAAPSPPSPPAVGLLARDPRMVERKKPGQPKARKKFQWVKR
jgi:small subunit ribosomal protein S9